MKKAWILVAAIGLMSVHADTASYSGMTDEVVMPSTSMETAPIALSYSPMGGASVHVEINGQEVVTASEAGTYEWTPKLAGTYLLTHRVNGVELVKKVVYGGANDAKELSLYWLDVPVSNLFPKVYASVTNIVIEEPVNHLP